MTVTCTQAAPAAVGLTQCARSEVRSDARKGWSARAVTMAVRQLAATVTSHTCLGTCVGCCIAGGYLLRCLRSRQTVERIVRSSGWSCGGRSRHALRPGLHSRLRNNVHNGVGILRATAGQVRGPLTLFESCSGSLRASTSGSCPSRA